MHMHIQQSCCSFQKNIWIPKMQQIHQLGYHIRIALRKTKTVFFVSWPWIFVKTKTWPTRPCWPTNVPLACAAFPLWLDMSAKSWQASWRSWIEHIHQPNLKKRGSLHIFLNQPQFFFPSKSLQIETIIDRCALLAWSMTPCWGSTSFGKSSRFQTLCFLWKTLHAYECDLFVTIISVYFKVTFTKTNMTTEKKHHFYIGDIYIFIHHSCLFILLFFHCHFSFPEV